MGCAWRFSLHGMGVRSRPRRPARLSVGRSALFPAAVRVCTQAMARWSTHALPPTPGRSPVYLPPFAIPGKPPMQSLPIDAVLPDLRAALASRDEAVLEAPPGAGKTTRVPLALLDEPWLAGQRILMLEPRRLAARAAAERLASELGEAVGETVGYRIRLDSKVGPNTRIEVVTEGILTRRLQADPALEGVGLVIFDEFHERSLDADLALALCLNGRELLRDTPLKLLVMSATLEGERLSVLLDAAPV